MKRALLTTLALLLFALVGCTGSGGYCLDECGDTAASMQVADGNYCHCFYPDVRGPR